MRTWSVVAVLGLSFVAACENPQAELQDLSTNNTCNVVDDCCVVMDDCNAAAWIVTRDEFAAAVSWAAQLEAGTLCVDCIPPTVTVDCVQGVCVGRAFSPVDVSLDPDQAPSSCGARELVNSGSQDIGYVEITDGQTICGDI
jgi:hypothetical protein